ncbi:MAG: hypothetical protein LBS43_11290 [Prevotellaceae bacterium]|nr:hypothetical protein [Prevotellaceae bacterium]
MNFFCKNKFIRNQVLTFGDAGIVVYTDKYIPDELSMQLLVIESDEDIRNFAIDADKVLDSDAFKGFFAAVETALVVANPAVSGVIAVGDVVVNLLRQKLRANKDDLVGYWVASLNRAEHYPHGLRDKQDVYDTTGQHILKDNGEDLECINKKEMQIKALGLLALMIMFKTNLNAQEVKSFWGSVEAGYGWNMRDNGNIGGDIKSSIFDGDMRTLYLKTGYYLLPRFSLGAGFGLRHYNVGITNTLPVFVDVRYHLKSLPEVYTYVDVGAAIAGDESDFTSGFMSDVGLAYKIRLGKRMSLNPSIGYNLFAYSLKVLTITEKRTKHTVYLQLGFQF